MRLEVEKFVSGEVPIYGDGISEDEIGTQMVPTDSDLKAIYENSKSDVDVSGVSQPPGTVVDKTVMTPSGEYETSSSKSTGAVLAAAVVLVLGLVAFFQAGGEEKESAAAVKTSVVTPPKPAIPQENSFHIESKPVGAEVFLDGKSLGETPVKTMLPNQKTPFVFVLSLKGHESTQLTCEKGKGATTTCSATLKPLPKKRAAKPRVKKRKKSPAKSVSPPPKKKPAEPVKEKVKVKETKKPKPFEPQIDLID
jgi:hypothetical protein